MENSIIDIDGERVLDKTSGIERPNWLKELANNEELFKQNMPVEKLMLNSLYYPGCGCDGSPIKLFNGFVYSFVYADYGMTKDRHLDEIHEVGLMGYSLVREREVFREEIVPNGWNPSINPREDDGDIEFLKMMQENHTTFGYWSIWKRNEDKNNSHGCEYISLFYLCGEMSAVYQGLYIRNNIKPKILAFIFAGYGLGCGWDWSSNSNYRGYGNFFKKVVRSNIVGMPEYLCTEAYSTRVKWEEYEDRLFYISESRLRVYKLDKIKQRYNRYMNE